MSANHCLFCRIAAKVLPSKPVYEDEYMYVFHDIYPKAPVHLLLIPKKHIKSLFELEDGDAELMGRLLLAVPKLAREQGLHAGFKTAISTGKGGGQEVDHLHIHVMGGW